MDDDRLFIVFKPEYNELNALRSEDVAKIKDALNTKLGYGQETIFYETDNVQLRLIKDSRIGKKKAYIIGLSVKDDSITQGFVLNLYFKENGAVGKYDSPVDTEFIETLDGVFEFLKKI